MCVALAKSCQMKSSVLKQVFSVCIFSRWYEEFRLDCF